jgi:hypothetical protein
MRKVNRHEFLRTGACASLALVTPNTLLSCANNVGPASMNAGVAAIRGDNLLVELQPTRMREH